MLMIKAQLTALGATSTVGTSERVRQNRTNDVAAIFSKMIVLKGQLRAAPDYYTARWPKHGELVNPAAMEEMHSGEGEQEVAWSVSPVLRKKPTQDATHMVVCFGKVFSRPHE